MRASGQQIDVRVAGVDAMRKMGIERAVRAAGVHEPGTQIIDIHGKVKAYFPAAEPGSKSQSMTSEYEIMRGELVKILYKLTEDSTNVEHVYDTTLVDFTQDNESDPNGKVHVTLSDGRKEDYDLVLAADGTGSKTRKIMLGPDAPDPRHPTGGYIAYFSIPAREGDSDRLTFCQLPSKRMSRALLTRKDRPDFLRVYMILGQRDAAVDAALKSGDLSALKRALADIYEGGAWETPRFMEALLHAPEADDLYCTPFDEIRLPEGSWSKGRVMLLGDAAHSATANGYGTSWGLVGPYLLAGELATLYEKEKDKNDGQQPLRTASIIRAAKEYERIFRPTALLGHGRSQWAGSLFPPKSALGIAVMNSILGLAAYLRVDKYIGIEGARGKWKLPDYPALDKHRGLT